MFSKCLYLQIRYHTNLHCFQYFRLLDFLFFSLKSNGFKMMFHYACVYPSVCVSSSINICFYLLLICMFCVFYYWFLEIIYIFLLLTLCRFYLQVLVQLFLLLIYLLWMEDLILIKSNISIFFTIWKFSFWSCPFITQGQKDNNLYYLLVLKFCFPH